LHKNVEILEKRGCVKRRTHASRPRAAQGVARSGLEVPAPGTRSKTSSVNPLSDNGIVRDRGQDVSVPMRGGGAGAPPILPPPRGGPAPPYPRLYVCGAGMHIAVGTIVGLGLYLTRFSWRTAGPSQLWVVKDVQNSVLAPSHTVVGMQSESLGGEDLCSSKARVSDRLGCHAR
jgi:hypothetical protein